MPKVGQSSVVVDSFEHLIGEDFGALYRIRHEVGHGRICQLQASGFEIGCILPNGFRVFWIEEKIGIEPGNKLWSMGLTGHCKLAFERFDGMNLAFPLSKKCACAIGFSSAFYFWSEECGVEFLNLFQVFFFQLLFCHTQECGNPLCVSGNQCSTSHGTSMLACRACAGMGQGFNVLFWEILADHVLPLSLSHGAKLRCSTCIPFAILPVPFPQAALTLPSPVLRA